MKRLLPLLAVVFLFTAQSCKQDLCEGVVCNNGGTCQDGECQCLPAWTGQSCDVHTNGCDTVVCLNGGNCLDATCSCPAHTSGQFCQIQEAPLKMAIWRLTVEHFNPAKPGGQLWDGTDAKADLYPVIKRGNTVIYDGLALNVVKPDATYDSFYQFVLGNDSIVVTDITNPDYIMELWDKDDGGPNELMYSRTFTPYTDSTGFRGSIDLADSSEMYQMGVYFRYFW